MSIAALIFSSSTIFLSIAMISDIYFTVQPLYHCSSTTYFGASQSQIVLPKSYDSVAYELQIWDLYHFSLCKSIWIIFRIFMPYFLIANRTRTFINEFLDFLAFLIFMSKPLIVGVVQLLISPNTASVIDTTAKSPCIYLKSTVWSMKYAFICPYTSNCRMSSTPASTYFVNIHSSLFFSVSL